MSSAASAAPSSAPALTAKQIVLDLAERAFIIAVFGRFAFLALSHFAANSDVVSLMMVVAESLPLFFIVTRAPSANMSEHPLDWTLGIAGTVAPLMVVPGVHAQPLLPLIVCVVPMLCGIYLQIFAKLFLGRSFGVVAANRGVRAAGPYRVLRHPIYAGYTLTHLGILLAMPSPRNALFYGTAFGLQIWRIAREERVLMQDEAYRELVSRVRYRLLPGVY